MSKRQVRLGSHGDGSYWAGRRSSGATAAVYRQLFGPARTVVAKRSRSFTCNFAEHTVKMCQRLKTDVVRNFTDPQVRIEQQGFGFFNPHSTKVFCKCQPGRLLEHFAKIKRTHVHGFCYVV